MAEWKNFKGEGPWSFVKSANKERYNEGDEITDKLDPVWDYPIQLGSTPITPVHNPGCGYWHSHVIDFAKNTTVTYVIEGSTVTFTLVDLDASGPYTWESSVGTFSNPGPTGGVNSMELTDVCATSEIDLIVYNAANTPFITSVVNSALEPLVWLTPLNTYIDPGNPVVLEFTGGTSPFSWSVVGTDANLSASVTYQRRNILSDAGSGCGTYKVTVTDFCGQTTTLNVINVTGQYSASFCDDNADGFTYREGGTMGFSGFIQYDNGWKSDLYNSVGDVAACELVDITCFGEYITSVSRGDKPVGLCRRIGVRSFPWIC